MLTLEEGRLADAAVAAVRDSLNAAKDALDSESVTLVYLTGSESARDARRNAVAQSQKVLNQLVEMRPGLTSAGLRTFIDLASTAADLSEVLRGSRIVTGAGFREGVVDPTLSDLNPFDWNSKVGRVVIIGAVVLVAITLARRA